MGKGILDLSKLIGLEYNRLTIKEAYRKNGRIYVKVDCSCGTRGKEVCYSSVKSGLTSSCGCHKREKAKTVRKPNSFHIGEKYVTKEGCSIEIIDYVDRHNVTIKFLEEIPCEKKTSMQNIKNGEIKYPYFKGVYGVGYYGEGEFSARENGKKTLTYIKWHSMMTRCYSEKYQEEHPSYRGCSVDSYFHSFQNFSKWMNENLYECEEPLELDKDLLCEGNKVYSPKTCCFIPNEINIGINTQRDNVEYMTKLYLKYKDIVPIEVAEALKKYTKNLNI